MTKIKLCGLSRPEDIETANRLAPEYIGFVFFEKSSRYVTPGKAADLKKMLKADILAVGVFVNAPLEQVCSLLEDGTIDIAQLHGSEDASYIRQLKKRSGRPVIRAIQVRSEQDCFEAEKSEADYILLDAGAGGGTVFDWNLLRHMRRPYFLAGGLTPDNVGQAVRELHPFAADVSSGIETGGKKDPEKMKAFVKAVRDA